jgi:hypothetical protein
MCSDSVLLEALKKQVVSGEWDVTKLIGEGEEERAVIQSVTSTWLREERDVKVFKVT